MERSEYWYWLCSIPGTGRATVEKLLNHFKDVEDLFHMDEKYLKEELFPTRNARKVFLESRNPYTVARGFEELKKRDIHFIHIEDSHFPEKLKHIYDCPKGLFYTGVLPDENRPALAIVGARNCTAYGSENAKYFARALSCSGVQIISGLARGIDRYAHLGALEGNEKTFAVLGCGANICYPPENIDLFMEIKEQGGLITEYNLNVHAAAAHFPLRNRIISGLSDGVLVIEAKSRSGSLITADLGLNQGKDVFALPGRRMDTFSEGCNNLIKEGAVMVTEPGDILKFYNLSVKDCRNSNILLDKYEKLVYASLCLDPKNVERLSAETGISPVILIHKLVSLELAGLAKQVAKNQYIKKI